VKASGRNRIFLLQSLHHVRHGFDCARKANFGPHGQHAFFVQTCLICQRLRALAADEITKLFVGGRIRVDDLDELLDVTSLIARVGVRSLQRICVYSSSGGAGVLSADKVGEASLAMATLPSCSTWA
jgi:acyl-CoA synthetase (NDP forming)